MSLHNQVSYIFLFGGIMIAILLTLFVFESQDRLFNLNEQVALGMGVFISAFSIFIFLLLRADIIELDKGNKKFES